MSSLRSASAPTGKTLSPAGCKVLALLNKKGCAYRVRGAWRLRGSSRRISEPILLGLLSMGLVERIETDRCAEIRITQIGRKRNGGGAEAADPPVRPTRRATTRGRAQQSTLPPREAARAR